ncbi:MAG: hypothetical protein JKY99_06075 [Rhizobiales bacterium]|nr:hypothetical protein [Hyphomicrobiales bacterium]
MKPQKPVRLPHKKFATAVPLVAAIMVWIAPTPSQAQVTCPCFNWNEVQAICDSHSEGAVLEVEQGTLSVYCDWRKARMILSPESRLYKATCRGPNTGINATNMTDYLRAMECLRILLDFVPNRF